MTNDDYVRCFLSRPMFQTLPRELNLRPYERGTSTHTVLPSPVNEAKQMYTKSYTYQQLLQFGTVTLQEHAKGARNFLPLTAHVICRHFIVFSEQTELTLKKYSVCVWREGYCTVDSTQLRARPSGTWLLLLQVRCVRKEDIS